MINIAFLIIGLTEVSAKDENKLNIVMTYVRQYILHPEL
jgi:hypothetical protein